MWERDGLEEEVATYVRTFCRAESLTASVSLLTLLRQQQEALGLSIPGMLRLRWVISDAPDQESKPANDDDRPATSARDRFRKIEGGLATG